MTSDPIDAPVPRFNFVQRPLTPAEAIERKNDRLRIALEELQILHDAPLEETIGEYVEVKPDDPAYASALLSNPLKFTYTDGFHVIDGVEYRQVYIPHPMYEKEVAEKLRASAPTPADESPAS